MKFVEFADSGCWLWHGTLVAGYGQFRANEETKIGAHRYSYLHFAQEIPESQHVHHLCHTKACVNPLHLRVLSPSRHRRTHPNPIKTVCKRGHLLSGKNLYVNGMGQRWCRACDRMRRKAYRTAKSIDWDKQGS